ncbi:MAG: CAP domain-containing protein [Candidatus Pacebacteria bacterium]|nr:CAP domain-containing protein [Candidatus Paceibacterota bacterium]
MAEVLTKKFFDYFIPNTENQFQPHFLQPKTASIIFVTVIIIENLFFFLSYYLIPSSTFLANLAKESIIEYTNLNRAQSSLPELKINPLLSKAAQLKAEDMAAKGYFSHVSPDNITPWDWLKKVNYNYSYAGENLALNFTDSEEVVKTWLNSEAHRQNILNSYFTEIGIGIAKGTYENQPAIFIVQLFGTPETQAIETTAYKASAISEETLVPSPLYKETPHQSPSHLQTLAPTITAAAPSVKSANVVAENSSSFSVFQKILSNPKQTTNVILIFFALIIIVALILQIFVHIRIQFPLLIMNGVLLLIVVASALWINNLLFGIWPHII